ncbi:2'-5' RNA ligase family protein [Mesorhizobium sp. M0028]|uniref:2'-5' RNA ligase family protein n=1 Tax=Mesorhizobium sp. M0028 TaxID=2956849 RepID=UPI00333BD9A7
MRGQAFPAERLHISLVGLGDYDGLPEELVEIARHVASMVQAKPFEVSFDRLSAFGGGVGAAWQRWRPASASVLAQSYRPDRRQPAEALRGELL